MTVNAVGADEIGGGGDRATARRKPGRAAPSRRRATAARRISQANCSSIMTGIDMLHVPYRGSGPAVVDVVGRTRRRSCSMRRLAAAVRSQAEKLRPLAAASARARADLLPDVPTFAELGDRAASMFALVRASAAGRDAAGRGATAQRRDRKGSSDVRHQGCAGASGRGADGRAAWSDTIRLCVPNRRAGATVVRKNNIKVE